MHREQKDENKWQENSPHSTEPTGQLNELSDVWRELLGNSVHQTALPAKAGDLPIPTLEVDPWSALLQAKGVEVVDLQQMHLRISDQEVEQMLQIMPDDLASKDNAHLNTQEHSSSQSTLNSD